MALPVAMGGCHKPTIPVVVEPPAAPPTVSVQQLASDLNLRVVRCSPYAVELRGEDNTVAVWAEPVPAVFVDGKQVAHSGRIVADSGVLRLSPDMVPAIRSAMVKPVVVMTERPAGPSGPGPLQRLPDPPAPPAGPVRGTVVLDPGHGGKDPGTTICNYQPEKELVLSVALAVRTRLEQRGLRVIMTRADDRFIELEDRAKVANDARADLFVSIHADSLPNAQIYGHTVYVARSANAGSEALARRLDAQLGQAGSTSRSVQRADYRVLVKTACPAALVEIGCLSNRTEAARLSSPAYRARVADAVAAGILGSLGR